MVAVVSIFLVLISSFYIVGLKDWSIFFSIVFISLGVVELLSVKKDGITLSEKFYRFTKKNKPAAVLLSFLLITSILLIVYHIWTMWGGG
jgi:hypothetical protein